MMDDKKIVRLLIVGLIIAIVFFVISACNSVLHISDLDWESKGVSFENTQTVECFWSGLAAGLVSAAAGIGQSIANWNSASNTQQEIWNREDTAVQRRAKDLEAAGLSKTLAAGSPASTAVTSAPQTDIGGKVQDALAAVLQTQQIKNAREENANMRKTREVMDSDIMLKASEMTKNLSQASLFNNQSSKAASDVVLNGIMGNYYTQKGKESKTYESKMNAEMQQLYYKTIFDAMNNDIITATGQPLGASGLAPSVIRFFAQNGINIGEMAGSKVGRNYVKNYSK